MPAGRGVLASRPSPPRGARGATRPTSHPAPCEHAWRGGADGPPPAAAARNRPDFIGTWYKSHLYRINGVEDHVHIFTSLHPTVCLAELIKDLKVASNEWIKEQKAFPGFTNWQDSYGAFTHSNNDKDRIIEYIKNQQEHHKQESFTDEFRRLLVEAGIEFDEKYLG